MVPELLGPWAERAVDLADPQPGECVLDMACGTGIGARLAAKRLPARVRIVGLDPDPAMLSVARAIAASLEWHCASALKMPYEKATFDLCMCFQGLQFFPDRVAGLAEMRRVLKASGRLVATVWAALEFNKGQHAIIAALRAGSPGHRYGHGAESLFLFGPRSGT
ncbi:MAG: methyltransferase domain-containing protein [Betaproteobacteria bacterium]|nr:methyltransferase domain-containing protein [Betaproteobacteria bacterium]